MSPAGCVLCSIVAGAEPAEIVAENERALAFMDANPATDGHTLVIPKAHAVDIWELDPEDGRAVWALVQEVARAAREALRPQGLTLFQANGKAGFQHVFHLHVHVVPRWRGDGLVQSWHSKPPRHPERIAEIAEQLRTVRRRSDEPQR